MQRMIVGVAAFVAIAVVTLLTYQSVNASVTDFSARRHYSITDANGNGMVRSSTGATAHVSPRYAGRFQALVEKLEAAGANVLTLGGIRKGRCSDGSQHPCGMALDVCQLRYGVVLAKCHLPSREKMAEIARSVGLQSASEWCHPDTGHFQVMPTGCHEGPVLARLHRHHRYARTLSAKHRTRARASYAMAWPEPVAWNRQQYY